MTRETVAFNAGRSGDDASGRSVLPQGPHWDLDLLTPDDVCALLKVKKSWLYDAVENGALEAIRLGKQLRFRPSALTRYLDERATLNARQMLRIAHHEHLARPIVSTVVAVPSAPATPS